MVLSAMERKPATPERAAFGRDLVARFGGVALRRLVAVDAQHRGAATALQKLAYSEYRASTNIKMSVTEASPRHIRVRTERGKSLFVKKISLVEPTTMNYDLLFI